MTFQHLERTHSVSLPGSWRPNCWYIPESPMRRSFKVAVSTERRTGWEMSSTDLDQEVVMGRRHCGRR